jgi:cytochrome c-type biogenesis protein CcmH/NrfG
MNNFGRAVSSFRDAIHREGERAEIPSLQTMRSREPGARSLGLRWSVAAAAVALLALGAIPSYQSAQRLKVQQREAEQEKADALLMEQVNAGLARSVPRAMTPLVDWAPGK